ncbi:MCE family protein, partial [Candidatus Sumerlaeota bacterium]|nr:MCE family protein [Candidatus Sumerlaeota bacterium]
MSANTNYYKIGLFVICAVVLGVVGVIALGIGAYSDEESVMIETYFDESVQGVEIGSPVKERGVRVGKVEAIDFVNQAYDLSPANRDFVTLSRYVVVRASLKPEIFGKSSDADLKELLKDLIKEGLRIRLTSQGLTGLVYLEIDYVDP